MSFRAKRELLAQVAPRYREAAHAQKSVILDEFVAATGYARKYAIRLLAQPVPAPAPIRRPREPRYGAAVREALRVAWTAANAICSKRLVPFLPELVPTLERHGHLQLTDGGAGAAVGAQPRDRRSPLAPRAAAPRDQHHQAGAAAQAADPRAHLRRLERRAARLPRSRSRGPLWRGRRGRLPLHAHADRHRHRLDRVPALAAPDPGGRGAGGRARPRQLLPFPLLGFDTDNGSEFLNAQLFAYCAQEQITFTRGRTANKNDQCFVEQKNGSVVRQLVGYERFEGERAYRQLAELYRAVRLYVNFFQPSLKLLTKQREGGHVRRTYGPARTPFQRVLATDVLPDETRERLTALYQALDPVRLLRQIRVLQDALGRHAVFGRTGRPRRARRRAQRGGPASTAAPVGWTVRPAPSRSRRSAAQRWAGDPPLPQTAGAPHLAHAGRSLRRRLGGARRCLDGAPGAHGQRPAGRAPNALSGPVRG